MEEKIGELLGRIALIFAVATLSGCCATCLDFDNQSPGTQFNVGDAISTSEISVSVEPFQRLDGTMDPSGVARVDNRNYSRGSGSDLNTRNVNLHPQHAEPLEKITFKFAELGDRKSVV